ncbi:MAG: hypothetical protein EZS28_041902, partial [Streblomastix strix]
MQFFLTGLFQVNLIIFHSRIWVLRPDFVVIQVLVLQKLDQKAGWPTEAGAGGVNKLDCQVYYSPKPEDGWACWKGPGYGKPQNCCMPEYIPNPWNGYTCGLGISCPEQNYCTIYVGVNVTSCGI